MLTVGAVALTCVAFSEGFMEGVIVAQLFLGIGISCLRITSTYSWLVIFICSVLTAVILGGERDFIKLILPSFAVISVGYGIVQFLKWGYQPRQL